MRKHFELTEETRNVEGRIVYRVRALVDLPHHNVKAGDLGGFVEGEHNLHDEAWVADNAIVCDNAALHRRSRAENYALVMGDASAWGAALIKDHATVNDFALVNQDATVSDYARVSEFARVLWEAKVGGHAALKGHATATEFARVSGWVKMRGFSKVRDRAKISGFAEMDDHAQARGDAVATGLSYLSGSDEIGKGAFVCSLAEILTVSPVGSESVSLTIAQALGGPKVYSKGISFVVDEVETALRLGAEVKDEGMVDAIAALFRAKAEEMGGVGWRAWIK